MVIEIPILKPGIADDVELANVRGFELMKPNQGVEAMVAAVNKEISDIQKQPATGLLTEAVEELRFGQVTLEPHMGGDVFQQQRFATALGELARMGGDGL